MLRTHGNRFGLHMSAVTAGIDSAVAAEGKRYSKTVKA
jgi:hypothetical protein